MNSVTRWGIAVAICLAPGSVFGDLANELDGYWTFDEVSGGTLHDFSGHGHNGTVLNFPNSQGNWTSGKIGGALLFGGPTTHQYVVVPNFPMPAASMTLTAWVWANSTPGSAIAGCDDISTFTFRIMGSDPYLGVFVADGNVPQGGYFLEYGTSALALSLNRWHFVTFVADSQSGSVTIMQDGVVTGSFNYSGQLTGDSSQLEIGGFSTGAIPHSGTWDGEIDDLAIWTRALSSEELTSIYTAGLAGNSLWTLIPRLSVVNSGGGALVQWPASMTNYVLEVTTSLAPPVTWTSVTNTFDSGGMRSLLVNSRSGAGFFRLRGP